MPPKLSIEDNGTKFKGKRKINEPTEGPEPQNQPANKSYKVPHKQGNHNEANLAPKTTKRKTYFKNVAPKTPPKSRNMTCRQMV